MHPPDRRLIPDGLDLPHPAAPIRIRQTGLNPGPETMGLRADGTPPAQSVSAGLRSKASAHGYRMARPDRAPSGFSVSAPLPRLAPRRSVYAYPAWHSRGSSAFGTIPTGGGTPAASPSPL